jgi:exodeoxyribonuclease VII small subunit
VSNTGPESSVPSGASGGGGAGLRPAGAAAVQKREMNFEEAARELEQIVQQLESGQADLDSAIQLWERGEELHRFCLERLDTAQGKIEALKPSGPA